MEITKDLPPLPPRRKGLYWAFREQADNPTGPGNDPIFAKMSEAVAEEIVYGKFGDILEEALDFRENDAGKPPMEPHHAMQLTRRNLQDKYLKMFPDEYPLRFDSVERNQSAIKELSDDDNILISFVGDQIQEEVRSNVDKRYAAVMLIAQAYRERVGSQPSILDVGCSLNNGLKAMARSGLYKFDPIEVVKSQDDRLVTDEDMTKAANTLIASRLAIGASMGVDLFPIDFSSKSWVRSCSFYPTELLKPAAVMRFDDLTNSDVRGIGFYQGDFSNESEMTNLPASFAKAQWQASRPRVDDSKESLYEMAEFMGAQHKEKELFDMVVFCTSMYLMNQSQKLRSIELAKKLVKKSGLIVIQDFAELDYRSRTGLRFHNDFQYSSYPYRTYVIPGGSVDSSPRHIFSWENGRARRLKLEAGRVSIKGSMESSRQLIRKYS